LLLLGAALSVDSPTGDLFESAVKRRFGGQGLSTTFFPGLEGFWDASTEFVAAVRLAAISGVLRGGVDGVAGFLWFWWNLQRSSLGVKQSQRQQPCGVRDVLGGTGFADRRGQAPWMC